MLRFHFLGSFVLSALFFFSPVFAGKIKQVETKELNTDDVTRLEVSNVNGHVSVEAWDKPIIEITMEKTVYADNEEEGRRILDDIRITMEKEDDAWVVETEGTRGGQHSNGLLGWLFGGTRGFSVSYTIHVPRKLDLDIRSTNGALSVFGGEGRMRLTTTNGKIVAEAVKGALKCHSTNGSITAELEDIYDDDMEFRTTNGSIKLYLPPDARVDMKARTTNGSIRCDLPLERYDYSSSKKVSGAINGGGPVMFLKTTNGSIRISES
ncbi:MAG: hypothetical protein D6677_01045, partial [Calditrichaeota bacterium]